MLEQEGGVDSHDSFQRHAAPPHPNFNPKFKGMDLISLSASVPHGSRDLLNTRIRLSPQPEISRASYCLQGKVQLL